MYDYDGLGHYPFSESSDVCPPSEVGLHSVYCDSLLIYTSPIVYWVHINLDVCPPTRLSSVVEASPIFHLAAWELTCENRHQCELLSCLTTSIPSKMSAVG